MFCRPDEGVEALTRSLHALPRAGIGGAGETQRRNILASVCELRAKSEEVLQRGLVWPLKATILACERAGKSGAASCSTRAHRGLRSENVLATVPSRGKLHACGYCCMSFSASSLLGLPSFGALHPASSPTARAIREFGRFDSVPSPVPSSLERVRPCSTRPTSQPPFVEPSSPASQTKPRCSIRRRITRGARNSRTSACSGWIFRTCCSDTVGDKGISAGSAGIVSNTCPKSLPYALRRNVNAPQSFA